MLNFCDFIQVYVFSTNHHLNTLSSRFTHPDTITNSDIQYCLGEAIVR